MRFPTKDQEFLKLDQTFYCRSRRKFVTLEECLDGYVDANAFCAKRSACFRCPLGQANRRKFAEESADAAA